MVEFWLGGAKGPGPDRLGFGLGGQGSWAGPAWFWLGGEPGWWGGKGDDFMYLYHNFSLLNEKECCGYSFILTFRYASFGNEGIGKCSYRWPDCYFTNVKPQI